MNTTPDYLKPYQDAVEHHGGTFDATLWRNKAGQLLRFKIFCDYVEFTDKTILDVGCGIGDFAQYLIENDVSYSAFHGIDAMSEMIETANSKNLIHCTFSTNDVINNLKALNGYDWITFSGTFNAMDEKIAMKVIESAFRACNLGVAFNFLSDQSGRDPKEEDLTPASRFNTLEWINFSLNLSPKVNFTQSYLDGHDATVIIFK